MMRARRLHLGLALLLLGAAESKPVPDGTIEAIESAYSDVQSLKAQFTQTSRSAVLGEQVQKGEVVLKRPRQMRWAFKAPDERSFITNGETMWVYSAPEKQVIITKELGTGGTGMPQLLEDLSKLDELFHVALHSETPQQLVLSLTPKQEQAGFKQLDLTIKKESYLLEKLQMTDQMDGQVEIAFSDVTLNAAIEDQAFQFTVPAGVEVIETGGM